MLRPYNFVLVAGGERSRTMSFVVNIVFLIWLRLCRARQDVLGHFLPSSFLK